MIARHTASDPLGGVQTISEGNIGFDKEECRILIMSQMLVVCAFLSPILSQFCFLPTFSPPSFFQHGLQVIDEQAGLVVSFP